MHVDTQMLLAHLLARHVCTAAHRLVKLKDRKKAFLLWSYMNITM